MNRTKYLKGQCQHCQGHLEFLAEHTGLRAPCPHCGQETDLLLPPPPEEPTLPRRTIIWTGIAILVLVLGLGGALIALQRAQRWAADQRRQNSAPSATLPPTNVPAAEPLAGPTVTGPEGLQASAVSLDHVPGTSLVYAVGSITNRSTRRRFGLKVEVELSDQAGQTLGKASDYRQVLEPGEAWQFKALVMDPKAAAARIISIHDEQ